jgi:TolB-like protein/tetratricopeptide (TPR) repeat protein
MQRDERATHLAYKACLGDFVTPLVSEHFGSMVKSTGDGFFAQFDSVVSAMECAVAIQADLSAFQTNNAITPALQFRLGVSSGDVISEEEDIYGNDVNLAARLQEQAQPGAICITAGTYEQVCAKLAAQFEDLGDITFKNSESPTRVYACYPEGVALWANKTVTERIWRYSKFLSQMSSGKILGAVALILTVAIGAFLGGPYLRDPSVHKEILSSSAVTPTAEIRQPSIAVLAFEDRSQSPETRALSLGIGDTVATALTASQRFFVIDPRSSLEFSSASPSVKDIARQLNVRFLLLGSINQKGGKIRVNARLVDMETGRNHWAFSVLEGIDKVFDIEDRIANEVIAALSEGPHAPTGKGIRGSTRNIAAYRSFLKGWQLLNVSPIPKIEVAIPYFEKAVLNDPNYGNVHAALAAAYVAKSRHIFQTNSNTADKLAKLKEDILSDMWAARQEYLDKAHTYLDSALKNPTAYAYRVSAQLHYIENNYEAATRDARNAYLRDPNDADTAAEYGMSLIWNGETADGVKEIEKAIRINPRGKRQYGAYLGIAKFVLGQHRTAIVDFESALDVDPHNESVMIHLVAAYGQLEELEKALSITKRLNSTRALRGAAPIYVQRIMRKLPYKHQSNRLHLAAGLHKAGMQFGIANGKED